MTLGMKSQVLAKQFVVLSYSAFRTLLVPLLPGENMFCKKNGRNLEAAHSTQQVELLNSAFLALLLHTFRGTLLSSPAVDLQFSPLMLTSLFQRHTVNQRMG
jgi:ABC-type transporter Mla MlaB component